MLTAPSLPPFDVFKKESHAETLRGIFEVESSLGRLC